MRRSTLLLALAVLGSMSLPDRALSGGKGPLETGNYESALSCAACHAQPLGPMAKSLDLILLTEYSIWATHDKHAQAHAILKGPRSRKIAENLKQDVLKASTGCLACHSLNVPRSRYVNQEEDLNIEGVSCNVCHGPSRGADGKGGWFEQHDDPPWRKLAAADKEALGLRDVRDPEKRAALCMSCHIGSAAEGKVATHAMFMAGHPPLPPFEVAAFSLNEPQHWRDAGDVKYFRQKLTPEVRSNYHLEQLDFRRTRQAVVGQVVALRETMRLVRDRSAAQSDDPGRTWPELRAQERGRPLTADGWPEVALAHLDCYACHHELTTPASRQRRGFGYPLPGGGLTHVAPGRPLVRAWPLTALEVSLRATGKTDAHVPELTRAVTALARASANPPFGNQAAVHQAAHDLERWCDSVIPALRSQAYDEAQVLRLLRELPQLATARHADYETARQLGALFDVIYQDWRDARKGPQQSLQAVEKQRRELSDYLNLQPYTQRARRLETMLDMVRTIDRKRTNIDDKDLQAFTAYIGQIGKVRYPDELTDMRGNNFLTAMIRLEPKELVDGLQAAEMARQLQEYSDAELAVAMQKMSAYRADTFYDKLSRLCAALPDK
jgi:hypothetical protein